MSAVAALAPALAAESGGAGSTAIGVVGLAALFLVAWLWGKAKDAGRRSVNRAVFSGDHRKGQTAVRQGLAFTAPAAPADVLERVVATVNAHDKPPGAVGGLYLASSDATSAHFSFGSRLGTSFRTRVHVTPDGDGTSGVFDVLTWTETDGLVDAVEQIDRVRERVASAVRSQGGDVQVTEPAPTS